ncbi:MAG: putative glycosyltransferase [Phycisphaerales bacterium]|nr:putative glycosyltransferase [Phycisphaerales bacterium]
MTLRRNILLFHSGALGDFIVTWPVALALARLHPQSRVFCVTQGQKGALAERVLRVESMDMDSGGWHRLFGSSADLPAPAARALAGAHTVVSFLASPDDVWSRNVMVANPEAKLLTISSVAPESFAGHQSEFLIDQLAPWPAARAAALQILRSINERGLGNQGAGDGAVVIHPGGGAPRKCWPAGRYLELARRLRGKGRPVRVLLGEVELERWPAEQIAQFREAADVRTPASLLDLLGELTSATAFVGNDSGPGHLAGVLGLPTLSLFGSTSSPVRWKPLGPHVRVLSAPLESLEREPVADALEGLLQ